VQRNRIKRLLREAFAREQGELAQGHDVVVVARPAAGELAEREGLEGIQAALRELMAKTAGARRGSDGEQDAGASAPGAA